MILNSQPKQLTLNPDGQILWQIDASNPLPGQPVAVLCKGTAQLSPGVTVTDNDACKDLDKDAVAAFLKAWVDQHVSTVLAPLTGLNAAEGITGPAKDIAGLLYDALGIIPRQDIEPFIAMLDPDARKVLRQRHVRLGPVLVFIPELNKPAAIKLRALLWWLWNDRTLPAPLPKDGVVSVVVDESATDLIYQRAIGYPVYGGRAIRVDMLDRLISAIYDNAKNGTFKATHAMAEWMGCSIPDLYKIIESMGHKKITDPADQSVPKIENSTAQDSTPGTPPEEESAALAAEAPPVAVSQDISPAVSLDVAGESGATSDAPTQETPPAILSAKPELAVFRLKRGKANDSNNGRANNSGRDATRPAREHTPRPAQPKRESLKDKKKDGGFKDKAKGHKSSRDQGDKKDRFEKKQTSFEARPQQMADSPFAMLQQLKVGMKDK